MKKRFLSLLLCLCIMAAFIPTTAFAASTGTGASSDMDALTALGIDSSAPEGYDPNSTENPFGKDTVSISPVYELYKVGLSSNTSHEESYPSTGPLQNGSEREEHNTVYNNSLTSTLYGNEAWNAKTSSDIMAAAAPKTIASGTTTATGSYTKISTGTVNDAAATDIAYYGYLTDATGATTNLGSDFSYALSQVASGNFTGSEDGLSAQTVMVYTTQLNSNGGLFLRFGDAKNGTYGTSAKVLLPTTAKIGNPDLKYEGRLVENFAEAPYQLQNYLQTATGDWNGDGLDEVAVYIPEVGNSRIVVYALQLTGNDNRATAYQNPAKWSAVWTYYLSEGDVVSNMVSLTSGDVNKDGRDDLAATWGYYYGPLQNKGSKAVVMFGAKGTSLFTKSQQFDLSYGSSNIVRASFAFGDMSGSSSSGKDTDVLILCGQSDADLKDGNTQTRYVALYDWNGTSFVSNLYQNFNLFEKSDEKYVWTAMSGHNDTFYSLPLCTANTAIVSQTTGGDLLYFDSLIIEYTNKGLNLKEAWDNQAVMQDTGDKLQYVEYGATAGDLTGQKGAGTLFTMTQTLSSTEQVELKPAYTATGTQKVPVYGRASYYKNWLHRLFNIKTYYTYVSGTTTVATTQTVNANYEKLTLGSTYLVAASPSESYQNRSLADFSTAICLANTDQDSSYMNYSGKHYYTYTDPEVLAVLASPPYFSDLLNREDLSGNYAESATAYSKTEGSGSGSSVSATISIGAYVAYEQDIQVFGVTVASVEAEAAITGHFTYDTEKTATLEQTVTYTAATGEDMVAFYSIPMEIYEYTSYVPDGKGNYKEVLTTVNLPHEAAIRLLSLDEYESIAKDYRVLPTIAANALTHTIGDPSTYPVGTDGYHVIAAYNGTPAAVGFSSTAGGSGISQEIAMSSEKNTAYSASAEVEAKVGAGAGGFTVGVIAGAEIGAGKVTISTSGSSFSGSMQNMPIEAQPYGYGMNWRIFCYKFTDAGRSFPVVSYLVSDVRKPPSLPSDFQQDISSTTDHSATLTWSYSQTIAGFNLYRYYEFPDGSGSHEVAYIPFSQATRYDQSTGTYYFSYTDTGLSPYTEYDYQLQALRGAAPTKSIYSEPISCRTKTAVGYPSIVINGLSEDSGSLPIYPDADSTAVASVANSSNYKSLSYQWQKLTDGSWSDLSGKTTASLTIRNAGAADDSSYRCRVNAIYYDTSTAANYYISAYSDPFRTVYSKRTPVGILTSQERVTTLSGGATQTGLTAGMKLYSANANHSAAPTGNVTFTVTGTDYKYNETQPLAVSLTTEHLDGVERYYSTASLNIASLPTGVYTVSAYYSGSKVFKDIETPSGVLVVVGDGQAYRLSLSTAEKGSPVTKFTYGKSLHPLLEQIGKDIDGKVTATTVTAGVSYEIEGESGFAPGSPTPNVGSYTLLAKVNDVVVASLAFSVSRKPVTISVANRNNVSAGAAVNENPPVIESTDLTPDQLAALKLSYVAVNSAGNPTSLNDHTEPGRYTVTACVTDATPSTLYSNYNVTYHSGSYIIVGATFRLTVNAANYTDSSGTTRPVGTAGISSAAQNYADYTAGTTVVLYATPQDGYQVDTWTVAFENSTTKTQSGGTTYPLTTEAQPATVTVTFKPAEIRLFTVAQPVAGGTVTCSDSFFSSGAYVSYGAEYTFTAAPKAGYHFSKWQTVSGGTTAVLAGAPGPDGSNSLTVTAGKASMTVYAIFERDAYLLTLSGDIQAYYMYDDDGNSTTAKVKRMVTSGGAVPGDTEITVEPKTGYQAAAEAYFTDNEVVTAESASYTFTITENTAISLTTVRNVYAVTVAGGNGSVTAKINGETASAVDLAAVSGGNALTFAARANRGYRFDHWTVERNGTTLDDSAKTLTIAALGDNLNVTAVFLPNPAYTVTAAVSDPTRGAMNFTLSDIYGEPVAENNAVPAEGLTVYEGESIVLSVALQGGSMVEQWAVNGNNTYTTRKTYPINQIDGNIDATAYLKAASSYAVYYVKMGESAGTLAAMVDDSPITSGSLQYGGSTLQFSATPQEGDMVDHWTITSGDLTAPEGEAVLDSHGNLVLDPIYTIDPLMQNSTIRVHFTVLETNTVTLPDTTAMGTSSITYVTPIHPTDDGTRRATTSESVRTGGRVSMTFTPASGYGTGVQHLEALLEAAVNEDATVSVEDSGAWYTATIGNLTQGFTLAEDEIYHAIYTITVPSHVTASVSSAVAGDTVTLTVSPETGYQLSALTLDNGTLTEAVSADRLSYTFTMPAGNVVVTAEFVRTSSGDGGGGGGGGLPAPSDGSVQIPLENLTQPDSSSTIRVESEFASVLAPSNMLTGLAGISGTTVELKIAQGDKSTLSDRAKEAIGDKPLISLQLLLDGIQTDWSNPGAPVTVSIPYQPTAAELKHPSGIIIWYIDGSGNLSCVPTGRYDAATGSVIFNTTHFSHYAVGYNRVDFQDVSAGAWYHQAVSFIAARGITTGTGGGNFTPDAKLTRGQFIVMLLNAYGIKPEANPVDNFSDAGNTYYTGYLASAKRLGISNGVGNNRYLPESPISRQEMFTLLHGALKVNAQLPTGTSGKDLTSFNDANEVAPWAKEAMSLLTQSGIVSGSNGNLNPTDTTTRAEMAQVLYHLLSQ